MCTDNPFADEPPAQYPIDGVLDLHQFHPREAKDVVEAYLEACLEKGILDVRIIHGKGIGTLRERVHGLLKKHPQVASFRLGGAGGGEWGATIVRLKPSSG